MFKINPFFTRRGSPMDPLSFADDLLSKHIAIQRNSAMSFAELCENPFVGSFCQNIFQLKQKGR
jgi:hypothetical protein